MREVTKGEIHDVVGILGLLGVQANSTAQRVPSMSELMQLQSQVLELITCGSLSRQTLQGVFNTVDWAFADGSTETTAHIVNRNKRATYKLEERMEKAGVRTWLEYLTYQVLEEIGEVGESVLGTHDTRRSLLDLQKAILKIIRFGAETVIKDSGGTTNATRALTLFKQTGITFDGSLNSPSDVNKALKQLTHTINGEDK
tara:strand:+ start:239 stop:838 length:600 start_codon:yes stop_codon:yes gene_type:complete